MPVARTEAMDVAQDLPLYRRYVSNDLMDIQDFHEKFKQDYHGPIRMLPQDLMEFRLKFLKEEIRELEEAHASGDMEKALDALIDLDYVLKGTVYLMGMQRIFRHGWVRVHDANMKKELASEKNPSKRGFNQFDIVKPPGWQPPSHADLIAADKDRWK